MREDLQAFLDGELAPERARELKAALESDPSLAEVAEELRAVDRMLGHYPPVELSTDFTARVKQALRSEAGRGVRSWWRRPWVAGLAAASLLVAAGIIWNPFTHEVQPELSMPPYFPELVEGTEGELEQLVTDIEWISDEFLPLD